MTARLLTFGTGLIDYTALPTDREASPRAGVDGLTLGDLFGVVVALGPGGDCGSESPGRSHLSNTNQHLNVVIGDKRGEPTRPAAVEATTGESLADLGAL